MTLAGYSCSPHVQRRMQERDSTPQDIMNTIINGTRQRTGDKQIKVTFKLITIVLDELERKLITAYAKD